MKKTIEKILLVTACLAVTTLLHAQTVSNRVWFAVWNGAPNPGSDVAVQSLSTGGAATAVATGSAVNFISQTNFPALNSPYDVAVDPVKGKVYVLDNNVQGNAPEYIYSFNLTNSPAQIAASAQIIYTVPVPAADANAGVYPLISGLALDPVNHMLYFNQLDVTTGTNSYIGRLNLAGSSPVLQMLYAGQIPGQGALAIDQTNLYLSAINGLNGNNGIYAAPLSGSGTFTELVTLSAGNVNFPNGLVSGVASVPQNNLIYYLTFNAGVLNNNYSLAQNALWSYNTVTHANAKIASGYKGYPDNIAIDAGNNQYYFTLGRDATGNAAPTNYQAIYTGALGSTSAPTLFYTPALSGQDVAGQANAGNVTLQGIYIQDIAPTNPPPVAVADFVNAAKNQTLNLPVNTLLTNDSDPDNFALSVTGVSSTSTNGGSVALSNGFVIYKPVTNFTGRDRFTYTLTDGPGAQAQGTVTVNVLSVTPPATHQLAIAVAPAGALLIFSGSSGQNYIVQYANVLTGPWYNLSPAVTANSSGFVEFNDLKPFASAMKFYRVSSAP